jgi:hypothetical protein
MTFRCFALLFFLLKFIYYEKVTKFCENFPLTIVLCSASQKYREDFAKFCGLLRIYELYLTIFPLALFLNILPKFIAEHFSGHKFPFEVLFKFSKNFDEVKKSLQDRMFL